MATLVMSVLTILSSDDYHQNNDDDGNQQHPIPVLFFESNCIEQNKKSKKK